MHWLAIAFLLQCVISLSLDVRRLECKANGMEWAQGTQAFGYCRTPGVR